MLPGGSMRPIECSSITPSSASSSFDLAEEVAIVGGADMLEHADGDDAVEGTGDVAVVAQVEADAIAEARGRARPAKLCCSSRG